MRRFTAAGAVLLCAVAMTGVAARAAAFEFVDLRFQQVYGGTLYWQKILAAALFALLLFGWEYTRLNVPEERRVWKLLQCNLSLLCWIPFWFIVPRFWALPLLAASGAGAAALTVSAMTPVSREFRHAGWFVAAAALFCGLAGGALQSWSYAKMALSWYDWGHFYEVLVNTLNGKFFYLNLENGSYLGSRFCPTLLLLLPVAALRSPPLFLTCGALLVASGAVLLYAGARVLKLAPSTAALTAITYLLLPVTINQFLVLLDGFHEVYLLVPLVFGAWACYRSNHPRWAVLLVLLSFGVRESIGFMWAGWGIVLFLHGKRKTGTALFLCSIAITAFLLGWLMPRFGYGRYVHTVYFGHLGNSIGEIALSPFTRPKLFWGTLFSLHNLLFWLTLLIPFVFPACFSKFCWLPMLPDLLMVSLDHRFDSQNVLRHYQIVPLMVLSIAAVEGIAALSRRQKRRAVQSALGAYFTGALLLSSVLTQIPGLPASDPRLPEWSYAAPVLEEMTSFLPPGCSVTTGPRIASHLAGKYDLHLLRGDPERDHLAEYVAVESFIPTYCENSLRMKLLCEPGWKLIFSDYLDERLIQLFQREPGAPPTVTALPPSVVFAAPETWRRFGAPIPCSLPQIELRGLPVPGGMQIAVRIREKINFDLGIAATLNIEGESRLLCVFSSFGDGRFPAQCAAPGMIWVMQIPIQGKITGCKTETVILP